MATKATRSATPAKSPKKKAASSKAKSAEVNLIEKVSEGVLKKLKALKAEPSLQADIEWCLGSYRYDKNPAGLYIMAEKALPVLKALAAKNSKAVPAKLLNDLSQVLAAR
jgi:hypothetical protein